MGELAREPLRPRTTTRHHACDVGMQGVVTAGPTPRSCAKTDCVVIVESPAQLVDKICDNCTELNEYGPHVTISYELGWSAAPLLMAEVGAVRKTSVPCGVATAHTLDGEAT